MRKLSTSLAVAALVLAASTQMSGAGIAQRPAQRRDEDRDDFAPPADHYQGRHKAQWKQEVNRGKK